MLSSQIQGHICLQEKEKRQRPHSLAVQQDSNNAKMALNGEAVVFPETAWSWGCLSSPGTGGWMFPSTKKVTEYGSMQPNRAGQVGASPVFSSPRPSAASRSLMSITLAEIMSRSLKADRNPRQRNTSCTATTACHGGGDCFCLSPRLPTPLKSQSPGQRGGQ